MKYLDDKVLNGLKLYKYRGLDTSPIAKYVMKPFWESVVSRLPTWLAPNLMTLIGWVLMLANVAVIYVLDPNYDSVRLLEEKGAGAFPWYVWVIMGVAQFVGHTADGCDGIQARRTGTSSPLGELFDHGLDSSTASLQAVALIYALGGKSALPALELFVLFWVVLLTFYTSHFEKYNTGVLDLPWLYDPSQIMIALVFVANAVVGPAFWTSENVFGYSLITLLAASVLAGAIWACISSGTKIVLSRLREPSRHSLLGALSPLVQLVWMFGWISVWVAAQSPSFLESHIMVILLWSGVLFAHSTSRLIVAQMTATDVQVLSWISIPLILLPPVSALGLVQAEYLLFGYFVAAVAAHAHYWSCVVYEISDFLRIRVFKIKPKLSQ